nr:substrate-binding domain-containing protein [Kiritimatiellia bacterium]
HNLGYPLILVDHRYGDGRFDTVAINNVVGGRRAVEHLLSLGHRRIGFVGGSLRSPSFRERLDGYREALSEAGIPADESLVQLGESHGGHDSMMRLLDLPEPPTAVFACNDLNAVRALKAARQRGLRVPEDVSLIGYDDASCAVETWPHLTTMRVDAEEMGRLAVRRLVARINGQKGPAEENILVSRLVTRDSTTFPKGSRGGSRLEMRKQSVNLISYQQGVPT